MVHGVAAKIAFVAALALHTGRQAAMLTLLHMHRQPYLPTSRVSWPTQLSNGARVTVASRNN